MTEKEFYRAAKKLADAYLESVIGLGWDDLADTNSLWDYIDTSIPLKDQQDMIIQACDERMDTDMGE